MRLRMPRRRSPRCCQGMCGLGPPEPPKPGVPARVRRRPSIRPTSGPAAGQPAAGSSAAPIQPPRARATAICRPRRLQARRVRARVLPAAWPSARRRARRASVRRRGIVRPGHARCRGSIAPVRGRNPTAGWSSHGLGRGRSSACALRAARAVRRR
jgi:hypothetical protein